MIKKTLFLAFYFIGSTLFAQKSYFQQEVNYKIKVSLDDEKHSVKGDISIEYVNNSPDALNEIWMHLWGNAYKNQRTAYAKQQLEQGKTRFYFAKENDLGYFSELNFMVNNTKATWSFDPKNPDIALIKLNTPLKSGEKLTISTPFSLKIPASFSRLGHVGQSYQMTQWFPKPAVYDTKGWHAIPYLNQGEFYSEFGNFDVSITLPSNYVVGATGICEQASEYVFLAQKVAETEAQIKKGFDNSILFPPSATSTKTLRYTASNVHDFAWFADKRFYVLKKEQLLASGKKVDCWAMFTNEEAKLWTKGADYIARAVKFYSDNVGEYPYPHATAVQSALSAGGGMEYPMITVIDKAGSAKSLDVVITHEVGHNWFYGILASNERDHGWMDEGMNTYYETRYTKMFWKKNGKQFPEGLSIDNTKLENSAFQWSAAKNEDQAPNTTSNDLLPLNYGTCMYQKTGRSMELLEQYVGTEFYDKTMKSYYDAWKFKHPYPEDFRKHWETATGKDLSWFFDGMINSNQQTNISFTPVKNANDPNYDLKFNLKSTGLNAPVPVSAIKDGNIVLTKVYEKPTDKNEWTIDFPKGDYDKIMVDADRRFTQPNRFGTVYAPTGKRFPSAFVPNFTLLNIFPKDEKKVNIGVLPAIAFNYYDKAQFGLLLYSSFLPTMANTQYFLAPMYSPTTKKFTGIGNFTKTLYPTTGKISRMEFSLNARSFSMDKDLSYNYYDRYQRGQLSAEIEFRKPKLTSTKSQTLSARYVFINNNYHNNIDFKNKIYTDTSSNYGVAELKYTKKNDYVLSPTEWNVTLQAGKGFAKIFAHYNKKIQFDRKKEAVYFHAFAGKFLAFNQPQATVGFQANGKAGLGTFQRDYLYDQFLLARNTREPRYYYNPVGKKDTIPEGSWRSQQIFMQDANMRTLASVGSSSTWMVGGGLSYNIPLPLAIGIRPYADIALFPEDKAGKTVIANAWTVGIAAVIVPDIFEIYFPIPLKKDNSWTTLNSESLYFDKRTNYTQRISFMLNINKLNPYKLLNKIKM
jgi:Peptidase family M1 domain